jgi:hypothetical protein
MAAQTVVAAGGTVLDLSPEDATIASGGTVTLSATIFDGTGQPDLSDHTIRFYFLAGSANDPGSPGNSPDFTCDTLATGGCSVSYVAANDGEDLICALVAGNPALCDSEQLADPELDNNADTVHRTIGAGGPTPIPTPTPISTPAPTPTSTATPTPAPPPPPPPPPTPPPPPGPTPSPTPAPTPTPTAAATPTPSPTPAPTPTATATPTPSPTPSPTPTATPTPAPSPTPTATPTPTPISTPAPAATPTPTPAPTATAPLPTATPDGGSSSEPTPTPSPTDDTTGPSGGHRPGTGPGSGTGGGTTGGSAPGGRPTAGGATGTRPAGPDDLTRGGGVLSTTGLPGTSADGHGGDPGDLFSRLIGSIAAKVGPTVQPAAAAAVATTFGFPLALMLAVVLFLIAQARMDGRDPKLRAAPLTTAETYIPFAEDAAR